MIGFQTSLQDESAGKEEGMDTIHLEKKELYDMLKRLYYIPKCSSKGLCRRWLLMLKDDKIWRCPLSTYRHFEVNLTPEMIKRAGVVNNAILVRKLNKLLQDTGRKPLGFEEFDPPEQVTFSN